MPTYGYQCTECKHEFSVFQAMKDAPVEICPQCGSKVKRLLYPVGIVFKGSGWYVNDSRKPDTSESASSEKAEGDKTGDKSGSETKTDSTDSKTDSKTADKPAAPATPTTTASSGATEK